MLPVAIFRHVSHEGPGYLAGFLDAHRVPWQLIAIDEGDAVPHSVAGFSGLVFMGGPMSVNDDLPWIAQSEALIRAAVACDMPVLGHCLGGQLMSKALGGVVKRNSVREIGWGEVVVADGDTARAWCGDAGRFTAFHWHGETFSLPSGAVPLLSSVYCANQAWVMGKHLALQCHVEMTAELIASWCKEGAEEVSASRDSPAVQSTDEMVQQAGEQLPQLHQAAERLYSRWMSGLQ